MVLYSTCCNVRIKRELLCSTVHHTRLLHFTGGSFFVLLKTCLLYCTIEGKSVNTTVHTVRKVLIAVNACATTLQHREYSDHYYFFLLTITYTVLYAYLIFRTVRYWIVSFRRANTQIGSTKWTNETKTPLKKTVFTVLYSRKIFF